jgi:mannose-6-phosphate isomerase class I
VNTPSSRARRKTTQSLLPATHERIADRYDLYPTHPLGSGEIELGFDALATRLLGQTRATLEGMAGVLWEDFREQLNLALAARGVRTVWVNVNAALKSESELEVMLEPFLGGDDPIFGTRFTGSLEDFFEPSKLTTIRPDPSIDLSIVYGCGSSLAGWEGLLVYIEVPKNEVQFRSRAGVPVNLGLGHSLDAKSAYKRAYFVDWPALNAHKGRILGRMDVIVDSQRPDEISFSSGQSIRAGLEHLSRNVFRARPWFEPGPWGGQWIKAHVPELPQDAPNYAWSFELITPENGLLFESDSRMLEVSFDSLMFQAHRNVLGGAAVRFGTDFPIRFDWLDTMRGGNLSLQCHPRPKYALEHFGEPFTQDETYYILEAEADAGVYLGFQAGFDSQAFRSALEHSESAKTPLEVERFVQRHSASTGDLFLIPNGTVHCSGAGVLVLEISATPYIFTFKMYDWLRLDLEGQPRPLNIERAMDNLDFTRQGDGVAQTLISKAQVLESGEGWRVVHLPTHPDQFYDVHRLEFSRHFQAETHDQCHVMAVVAGHGVMLEVNGTLRRFNFAETFVIPAAAGSYMLENLGPDEAKVIRAFVKSTPEPTPETTTQRAKP